MRRAGNTLGPSQHFWYNQRALVPITNWQAFQYKPNLVGPLVEGGWPFEGETRPSTLT